MSGFVKVGEGGSAIVAVEGPEPVMHVAVAVRQKARCLGIQWKVRATLVSACVPCESALIRPVLARLGAGTKALEEQRHAEVEKEAPIDEAVSFTAIHGSAEVDKVSLPAVTGWYLDRWRAAQEWS